MPRRTGVQCRRSSSSCGRSRTRAGWRSSRPGAAARRSPRECWRCCPGVLCASMCACTCQKPHPTPPTRPPQNPSPRRHTQPTPCFKPPRAPYLADVDAGHRLARGVAVAELGHDADRVQASILSQRVRNHLRESQYQGQEVGQTPQSNKSPRMRLFSCRGPPSPRMLVSCRACVVSCRACVFFMPRSNNASLHTSSASANASTQ